jgi:hypothetical protein
MRKAVVQPTDEQRRMADMLNLFPDTPEDWPMGIIDWLIELKATAPTQEDFDRDLARVRRLRY